MTTIEKYEPGTFCWLELATTDQPAATAFYTKLFGWEKQDNPLPDGGVYTMGLVGGRPAAAIAGQQEQERAQGIPPHWNLYIRSDDVDKDAARASEAGGNIIAPPFDVLDLGRMAVIADPTGAVVSVWQSEQMPGFAVRGEHGSFSWAELMTADRERAAKFYGDVFGWTVETLGEDMGNYMIFKRGEEQVAGSMTPPKESMPPFWMTYFEVSDADTVAAAARESGGRVEMEPMDIPNIGRFAVLTDPQGAVFAIIHTEGGAS